MKIGITERGDASVHFNEWVPKLSSVDGAILITKDPQTLLDRINDFDHGKCIIHCTITGWGGTIFEPGVPDVGSSFAAYLNLAHLLGPEKVVLRIDPIILTGNGIAVNGAINLVKFSVSRVRVSFMDMYKHVATRLERHPYICNDLFSIYDGNFHIPLEKRKEILGELEKVSKYDIEVCGEPGMKCTGCISFRDLKALGLKDPGTNSTSRQRNSCACLNYKTELLTHRSPCKHNCIYCYWRG